MAVLKTSKSLQASKPANQIASFAILLFTLAALSAVAIYWLGGRGYLLYYGDAEAHLNIARRIVDSRTAGYDQLGTVWLPLPHLLMLPFVAHDAWWRNGLAGAIPGGICFVIAGCFLFATVRRVFESTAAAFAAVGLFACNPNILYLQATPMTEPVFFAAVLGMLYGSVLVAQTGSVWAAVGCGVLSGAASMTRYEGWFLIPFVFCYVLFAAKERKIINAVVFGFIASAAPIYWLAHNWWCCGSALDFYNGPYSAIAIYQRALDKGMQRYLADGNWAESLHYFRTAAQLCAGWPLITIGLIGFLFSIWQRKLWPIFLLLLAPAFYIWGEHSAGNTIFVPTLWPYSYYNTRYALCVIPLCAAAGAAIVAWMPIRMRGVAAAALVLCSISPWLINPTPEVWICWKESQVNSEGRRAWTREAAEYLASRYQPGWGIVTSFGDLTGIFRTAGIPLKETLHDGNNPQWMGAVTRPRLFLHETWAVAISGDAVATAMQRASRDGPRYTEVKQIIVKGSPVVEIYRRDDEPTLYQGARR